MNRFLSAAVFIALLGSALVGGPALGAVPAGYVAFAVGKVSALDQAGKSRLLSKGSNVMAGETIDTGEGRAQVRFSDGAFVALQPQSRFRVDEYVFNGGNDGRERGIFSLIKGGLRTVTGAIGKRDKRTYQINTTVATIGVRGTEYAIQYGKSITGSVGEGEIEVCNDGGCLSVANGEAFYVGSKSVRPVLTTKKSDLPPPQPAQVPQLYYPCGNSSDCIPIFSGTVAVVVAGALGNSTGQVNVPLDAAFNPDGTLRQFSDPLQGTATTTFDSATLGGSDGIITWGIGHLPGLNGGTADYHYVAGLATSDADMAVLTAGNVVGTYRMIGATMPSVVDSTGVPVASATAQISSASLTANFGSLAVSSTVAFSSTLGSGTWVGTGTIDGIGFGLSGSCSVGSCSGTGGGVFAGPAAKDAGMVYSITPGGQTGPASNITGAVALRKQ